jgi:hypothetical protein
MSGPFPDPEPQLGTPPAYAILAPSYSQSSPPPYAVPPPVNVKSQTLQMPPYLGYGCQIQYSFDSGLVGQPVAAAKGSIPVDFVRLHTGYCLKVVTIAVTRAGDSPVVPSPDTMSQNGNDVLLTQEIGTFSPPELPDTTQVFGVIARYTYLLQQAPAGTDDLDAGVPPNSDYAVPAVRLVPQDFVQNLISPAAPVTNPPPGPVTW